MDQKRHRLLKISEFLKNATEYDSKDEQNLFVDSFVNKTSCNLDSYLQNCPEHELFEKIQVPIPRPERFGHETFEQYFQYCCSDRKLEWTSNFLLSVMNIQDFLIETLYLNISFLSHNILVLLKSKILFESMKKKSKK